MKKNILESYKTYGRAPYRILLLHGGPGAAGSLAPLAQELTGCGGIIDAWQTKDNIGGLLSELDEVIVAAAETPVILLGHSWGAWLACLYAARYPEKAAKLVLVGSAPFEQKYEAAIERTRSERFTPAEREELSKLEGFLKLSGVFGFEMVMIRYAELMQKADSFDPVRSDLSHVRFQPELFQAVWKEALELRKSGALLKQASKVACPVTVIHGLDDPHPAAGVKEPLQRIIKGLKFIGLKNCGHEPWNERHARAEFLEILERELGTVRH